MKRSDIQRAEKLSSELSNLEKALSYFQLANTLEISGVTGNYRVELGDYPEPSELGRTFAAVKAAMVDYYERAVQEKTNELTKIGIQVEAA